VRHSLDHPLDLYDGAVNSKSDNDVEGDRGAVRIMECDIDTY